MSLIWAKMRTLLRPFRYLPLPFCLVQHMVIRACMVIETPTRHCRRRPNEHTWRPTDLCMCRGKLMSMAGVLSQCLGSRSADDANRVMQPIVRAVTEDVQLGAKPASPTLATTDADQVASEASMRNTSTNTIEPFSVQHLSNAWSF